MHAAIEPKRGLSFACGAMSCSAIKRSRGVEFDVLPNDAPVLCPEPPLRLNGRVE